MKIYISGHTPDATILNLIQKAKGGFIANLYDHGLWDNPNAPGISHYYEVMEYAPHGSLADVRIKDERQFKDIAMRMAFCISQSHSLGIIHRDIKPENFLFTDEAQTKFVLTDFGIARTIKNKDGRVSVDNAKSSYFVSPEGAMSTNNRTSSVGLATDYYSMGMTLLAMWIGLKNFYASYTEDELLELKQENIIIEECGSMLKLSDYTKSLIRALVEFRPSDRAGFDEIEKWFNGETLKSKNAAGGGVGVFHIVFDETRNKVASSAEELAKLMLEDIEYAKLFLYRDIAKGALQQCGRTALALAIDDITQKLYPGPDEQDAGVFAACLKLDKSMPYVGYSGKKCATAAEIATEVWIDRNKYATELKRKGSRLWAYLTIRGDETLKKASATLQPIVARSGIHGVYALCKMLKPDTPFYDTKGNAIKTTKMIADELWQNRLTYVKELANPDHSLWVYLRSVGPNAAALTTKYPDLIKKNGLSDLYALCLRLDTSMPYYGKKGNACVDEKQVADELWDNFNDYSKSLTDANHMLWKYMSTWNDSWRKIADSYPALIAKKADIWLFDLIYRLDPTQQFTVQYADDTKWHGHNNFEEILDAIATHGITDFSVKCFTRPHFITWLIQHDGKRGAMLDKMVKDLGDKTEDNAWYIFYSIVPEIDLTLQRKTETPVATAEQIGKELNRQLNSYKPTGGSASADLKSMLSDTATFNASRLNQYMYARKMKAHADGIANIVNVAANIKAHPSAPYDTLTACWKVVEHLGHRPEFYFSSSKKSVSSLSEVRVLPPSDINSKINSGLAQYLTIFFHEKAGHNFSFEKLKEYHDFLSVYCHNYDGLKNAQNNIDDVLQAITKRDKAWRSLSRIRIISMIFCLVPLVFILSWMIYTSFTDDGAEALELTFMAIGNVIAVLLAIVGGLWGLNAGCFGMILGGLAGYWIPVLVFEFLSPLAPFIVAALVISAAVFLSIKLFKLSKDKYISSKDDNNDMCEQANLYIICETFGTTSRTFGSQDSNPAKTFRRSTDLANSQKEEVYKAAGGMILLALVTLGIGIALMNNIDKDHSEYAKPGPVAQSEVAGDYTGTFHERNATMNLQEATSGDYEFKGEITIHYSTVMTQNVVGNYDESDGSLKLYVMTQGVASQGTFYSGKVKSSGETDTYSGEYKNFAKGTRHDFTFSK